MYSIPCSSGKVHKSQTCYPLKVRLEEHQRAAYPGEIKNSGMADHIRKEKGNHCPGGSKLKIIDREEHWRMKILKKQHIYWTTVTC